jgi:hypothetical protein
VTTALNCRSAGRCDLKVGKPNLVAVLLEVGEENAAVLLARSDLPDEIDLGGHQDALLAFGLDRDQLDEVARLTVGAVESDDDSLRRRRGEMETTISRRWADLVDQWLT